MPKSLSRFIVMPAIVALSLMACYFTAPTQVAPTFAAPPQLPTQPPPPVLAPTIPPPTQVQYAPFCQGTPVSACVVPTAEERDRTCQKKIPYTYVAMSPGATFEVLTPDFTCTAQGVFGDYLIVACTGPMLHEFDLRMCNPACAAAVSGPGQGQCPQGYSYDAVGQCCALAPAPGETGCIQATFGTKECVLSATP